MKEDGTKEHFDNIADNYKEEIFDHIRDHLITRLWSLTSDYFSNNCKTIDIGCGDGSNIVFFRSKGVNALGLDMSEQLVRRGRERYPQIKNRIFQGDALNLQFKDNTFDVATMIGILHHIHSRNDQRLAIREALRVVRNNGIIVIRESNLINPLFRLFWNYVFPLTSKIDKFGGENWVSAKSLSRVFERTIEKIWYFTFMPNFTPQILFPTAKRVENFLESTKLGKLSAHYVAILRKIENRELS